MFRRASHVDLVVGPGQLGRLPQLLAEVAADRRPRLEVSLDRKAGGRADVGPSFASFDPPRTAALRAVPHQAMVRIMFGCDKFCTYCIVPKVRGPEQSRPAAEIEAEVRRLVDGGCLEVTLLGQTVNSYRDAERGRHDPPGRPARPAHEIEGLRRLKFVTNYPRHMTDDLLQAVRDLPKVSPYLHVPAQSGSDAVLQRMKRGYTAEGYREMIERLRADGARRGGYERLHRRLLRRDGGGFPADGPIWSAGGGSRTVSFSSTAPRPGTRAVEIYADDVPEEVKRRRNNELLAIQNAISLEDNQPYLGRTVEILVEGPSKAARKVARERGLAPQVPVPLPGQKGTGRAPSGWLHSRPSPFARRPARRCSLSAARFATGSWCSMARRSWPAGS